MGNGVGGHHEFETVNAGQEMVAHVPVPHGLLLGLGQPLPVLLVLERGMDNFDGLDKERGRAGGGIENVDKGRLLRGAGG